MHGEVDEFGGREREAVDAGGPEPDRPEPGAHATATDAAGFRMLDPRVVRLWRTSYMLWFLAVLGAGLALAAWVADSVAVVLVGVSLGLAIGIAAAVWPTARYRAWSFRVGERDVRLRYGVLWRTASVVPYARVQHVDTRRGPLERWLGLASLILFTAGTRGASLPIPGLDAREAEALRDRLAELSGTEDAV